MTAAARRSPRILAATAMAVAPLAALILARIWWAGELPETVASHWSGTAVADGFSDTGVYFWIALAIAAGCALGAVVAAVNSSDRPDALMWLPIGTIVGASAAATWILSVLRTNAAGDARAATLGWWFLLPLLAMAWGLAIFAVLPRQAPTDPGAPVPTLAQPLLPGERAVWFGEVKSAWAIWLAAALLIGAVPN